MEQDTSMLNKQQKVDFDFSNSIRVILDLSMPKSRLISSTRRPTLQYKQVQHGVDAGFD